MKINIADFYNADLGYQRELELSGDLSGDSEVKYLGPAVVCLSLAKADKGIMADLEIKASVELMCSRCAKSFKKEISLHADNFFSFEPAEDDEYIISNKDEIDFSVLIHDEVILSLPIKTLCSDDCAGLE